MMGVMGMKEAALEKFRCGSLSETGTVCCFLIVLVYFARWAIGAASCSLAPPAEGLRILCANTHNHTHTHMHGL